MKKRILPIFLITITLLVGCGHDVKPSDKDSIIDTTSETIGTTSSDTQDIVQKMLDNVILYNEKVSFPSSFDSFSDDYTAANAIPYDGSDISTYTLYYKDKNIGFIDLSNNNDIRGLYIDDDIPNSDFSISGIGYDSCRSDIINAFGEPDEKTETSYTYGNSESICIVFSFNDEKIRSIKIFY